MRDFLNELVIMRRIIPWQKVIERLAGFYRKGKGRTGKSLRMMVALLVVGKLRKLSDAEVIKHGATNFTGRSSLFHNVISSLLRRRYLPWRCSLFVSIEPSPPHLFPIPHPKPCRERLHQWPGCGGLESELLLKRRGTAVP